VPVICLFLDHKDSKNQTKENLFGSLLKQLLQLQESRSLGLPPGLRTLYRKAKAINAKPRLKDICDLLQAQLTAYDRVFIIVDALDECPIQVRPALQKQLRQLGTERVSLMFTSRFADNKRDNDICCNRCGEDLIEERAIYYRCNLCLEDGYAYDVCQNCRDKGLSCKDQSHLLTEPYGSVEIDMITPNMDKDIERYVRWEIGQELEDDQSAAYDKWTHRGSPGETRLQRLCHASPKLLDDITPTVVAMAEHRFLFAKLYMDILKVQTSGMAIRKALKTLPKDLDGIYDDAMRRIDAQDKSERDLAYKILAILVCAHRNLRVGELKHVLAAQQWPEEFGSDEWDDNEGCVGVTTILECTLGLISISDIEDDLGAVRMHRTLQEYLSDRRAKYFPDADKGMATACLTYLKLDAFSSPSHGKADFDARKKKYPFISYASQYWGDHVREAGSDEKLQADSFELVCDRARVAAFVETAWITGEGGPEGWDVRKGLDGFHVCAWYGLSGALSRFGRTSIVVDITEPTFLQTPLIYACRKGHVEVVRQLLDLGASVHTTSTRGRTPWFEAVEEGRDEVVDLLLGRSELEIDINSIQHVESNRTALMQAANLGYESIVSKLLEHPDIDVNRQDTLGYTALSLATVKGFHSVVELLLMRPDIELDVKEFKNGRSALVLAAERDDARMVHMLLQSGADWQLKDHQGGTAALRAVDYGCALTLNVLKSNNVSLHCVDEDGRTLLHGASRGGHSEILRVLVKEGLDKDQEDNNGLTPLHEASRHGKIEIIKVLLDLGADSTLKDKFDRTPFTIAWQYGQKGVMDMLPQEEQIPNDEALPIWALARRGLKSLLAKALEVRKNDALEQEPCIGNSPLHCAVFAKDPEILRMLLEDADLPRDSTNHVRRSALHTAAFSGNLQAAKDLIAHGAKLDQQDRWGDSPLTLSRTNHHYSLMIALIEAGAALDLPWRKIQEMLFRSAEIGSVKAARRLLENGATTNDKDVDGRTALDIARSADNGELLQVLQSTQTFFQRDNVATEDQAQIGKEARPAMPSLPSSQRLKLPFRMPELDQMNCEEFDFPSTPERLLQPVPELA
jgi:ankyrin repeat protein